MSTAHTPGPWHYEEGNVRDKDGEMIAEVWGVEPTKDGNEVKANAHLLAAAPEMFAALEKLQWTAATVMDQIRSSGPSEMIGAIFDGRELALNKEALKAANEILQKARGGQS